MQRRTVVILESRLDAGKAANLAALLGLGLGAKLPSLVGETERDGDGRPHAGFANVGIPILAADAHTMATLFDRAIPFIDEGLLAIAFPAFARAIHDYPAYVAELRRKTAADMTLEGIALSGPTAMVKRLTGMLPLWRA